MLFVLSPAKSLDYESLLPPGLPSSSPLFARDAKQLIDVLRPLTQPAVARLMDLSEPLAALNRARYKAWRARPGPQLTRQAVLAFNGDVYEGLNAPTLDADALAWAQQHLCILSGLYGVLRPLDLMQPYRLEMGTALANSRGRDLYAFWRPRVAPYLNQRLRADASPVLVNLASQEYFKAVDTRGLKARVVHCVFEDWKHDRYKIISFNAKRARGLMARQAIDQRWMTPQQLQGFAAEGYAYAPEVSAPERLVFRRRLA